MKTKISKLIVLILAVCFSISFLVMSKYFFEGFVYDKGLKVITSDMFFVSCFLLIFAVAFNILLFVFILKNKTATAKLFFTILPLTLLFVSAMYFLIIDDSSKKNVMAFSRAITSNTQTAIWSIAIIVAIYIILLFAVIVVVLKPIKQIQRAVDTLSNGYTNKSIILSPGKDFNSIEKGLNKINYNYKQNQDLFDKLNYEYSKYLPQQFVKQLGKKSVLELSLGCNVQKEITSMFVDIRNSTKTSLTLSLSDNFNFINRYLGIIGPAVRKYDGFVDKYLGDGVLAIFTSPDVAIDCANEIVKLVNQDSINFGLYDVKIGIGLHTGQVVMGVIGEKKRLSATVIADSVNTASYLEKLNSKLGTTVIFSKATLNALSKDSDINYRYVGCFELGGASDKVCIFESLDCYDGEKRSALLSTKKQFENAVRCFEVGGSNCKKIFKECQNAKVPDEVCKYYLKKFNQRS